MKKSYFFPGQGAQFVGMGKELCAARKEAQNYFTRANEILGFDLTQVMFSGPSEELTRTRMAQPAIFLHSVAEALSDPHFSPAAVAGHSLGEFSALVAAGALPFDEGLHLVSLRAKAMQEACDRQESTMAVVLGMEDEVVERVCEEVREETKEVLVPANYNAPGQLVISGSVKGVARGAQRLKPLGATRLLNLAVAGAFHSPLMQSAQETLSKAIEKAPLQAPTCPIYQNYTAKPSQNPNSIKENLLKQLTAPVLWKQSVRHMLADGFIHFEEYGPGKVLQGLLKKIQAPSLS